MEKALYPLERTHIIAPIHREGLWKSLHPKWKDLRPTERRLCVCYIQGVCRFSSCPMLFIPFSLCSAGFVIFEVVAWWRTHRPLKESMLRLLK